MMRLDKFLCAAGLASRSEVKKMIRSGCVAIDGRAAVSSDQKLDENREKVTVSGRLVSYEKYTYFLFHKPAGCITAARKTGEKTVMDYFEKETAKNLSPVGRLDRDTEGLLLVTNDGALTHHLLSPAHHVNKTYYVKTDKNIAEETVNLFKDGVDIGDDKPTLPADLTIIGPAEAYLTIREGRFHQVKRMFAAVGCNVIYLKRVSMGSLCLDNLACGSYRRLTREEVISLQNDGLDRVHDEKIIQGEWNDRPDI